MHMGPYFKRYAHPAGPFNYSILRWPALVSVGNAQPTAHRARVRKSSAFKLLARAYPRPSSWRTSVQSQPWPAAEAYRNIDVASGISMAIAHRACVYRGCIPAALGGVPRRWLDCPRKKRASKRQSAPGVAGAAAARGRAHLRQHTMETNQSSI